MIKKVRDTIHKYRMLEAGDSIVAGVSGGADSVAMLHVLLSLCDEFALNITAAHLNHKLRGDESERDEHFVKDLCKRLKVRLAVESADIAALAKSRRLSIEEAGREARYAFFSRCCSGKNACDGGTMYGVKIAVAHSLGDSVETMLLNLARGTGLRGLSGIPPKRDNIIRPLIECERAEIEAYCAENGIGFITDSTNFSDDFARNRIRRHAIPALLSVNEGFWCHAANTLEVLRSDADFLDSLAESEISVSRERYLSLPKSMRYRILSKMLSKHQIPIDKARLARLDSLVKEGIGAEQLTEEYFFKTDKSGFAVIQAQKRIGHFCVPVSVPENGEQLEIDVFSDKKLRLINTDYENCEENIKYIAKGLKNALDCVKISGSLVLRQKLPADSVRLVGRNCTKTLRKLFQERKLTTGQRERLFVLADDSGIVWVEGFGVTERVEVSEKTKRILILEAVESERI